MTAVASAGVFDRAGVAALSDLQAAECRHVFAALESDQSAFLQTASPAYPSAYTWPRDALHWWSRVWEYPFAFHHLADFLAARPTDGASRTVVDLGSGITFFPFSVARLGCDVTCLDIDPVCVQGVEAAARLASAAPGRVTSSLIANGRFPLGDASVDAIYCISVLEHIPDRRTTFSELRRVLRPGGWLVLTVDLDLTGKSELGPAGFSDLMACLNEGFEPVVTTRTVHPTDILESDNGPYRDSFSRLPRLWHNAKQIVKLPFGRRPSFVPKEHLAVYGAVVARSR